MSEISNNPVNTVITPVSLQINDSAKIISSDSFNSHVLAIDKQSITLSVPGQAVLVLDIGDNKQLSQLQSGQKLLVSVELSQSKQLTISIAKVEPQQQAIAQVPLSRDLANKLALINILPNNKPDQLSFIAQNSPIAIGQARRLPNEMIKLITSEQQSFNAALPSSAKVPLNQTYNLRLVIAKDLSPQVEFARLTPKSSPIVITLSAKELITSSPQTDIIKLLNNADIGAVKASALIKSSELAFDMNLPRNQLWLKHQPLNQIMAQLNQVSKEFNQHSLTSTTTATNQPTATMPSLPLTSLQPSPTGIEPSAAKEPSAGKEPSAAKEPSAGKEPSAAKESSATSKEPSAGKEPSANKEPPAGKEPLAAKEPASDKPLSTAKLLPTDKAPLASKEPFAAKEPLANKEPSAGKEPSANKEPASDKLSSTDKLPPAGKEPLINKELFSNKEPLAAKNLLTTKEPALSRESLNFKAVVNTKEQASRSLLVQPPNLKLEKLATQSAMISPLITQAAPVQEQEAKLAITNNHLSLQKLNALLNSLNGTNGLNAKNGSTEAAAAGVKVPAQQQSPPSLEALTKLQSLTKQLQPALPDMRQLTSAPMLTNLIEQFVRFDPLAPSSINLRHLGSLASAIQLILGGRATLTGSSKTTSGDIKKTTVTKQPTNSDAETAISPALAGQLKKILQQNKTASKANLLQAMAQLGNFNGLKSIEESLSALSGHLKLYQYQSQEQSANNQQVFFFTLPTSDATIPQVEGQIERGNAADDSKQRTWQLTLLLPVGNTDKIKACANLQGKNVEIEFVSNNSEIVTKAEFFVDFLSQRLTSLGLTTTNISCKQAELPKSLLKRPNQLVELMV